MTKNFIGKWELLSNKSEYAKGIPPKSAFYEFRKEKNNSIGISINWLDYKGKSFEINYQIMPDGQLQKLKSQEIAGEIMSEFVSALQLNSSIYKNETIVAFTTRTIDKEGVMKVVQRFYPQEGSPYENIQYYRK